MKWVMGPWPRVRVRPRPRVDVRMMIGQRKMMSLTLMMVRPLSWAFGLI